MTLRIARQVTESVFYSSVGNGTVNIIAYGCVLQRESGRPYRARKDRREREREWRP